MQISTLYTTQRTLKRAHQIPEMLKNVETLPLICLSRHPDGLIQIENGHHSVVAIFLSGRTYLKREEYVLIEEPKKPRERCGLLTGLIEAVLVNWAETIPLRKTA